MSTTKEPDFFARPELDEIHPLKGPSEQRSLHDDAGHNEELSSQLAHYEGLFAGATDQSRRGEASALYLGHATAAWHLRSYAPDSPLVVILRDPAERAFSHLVHARRIYAEQGYTSPAGAEGRTIDEEFERAVNVATTEGMPEDIVSEPEIWVRAGFYHAHLSRWFELFPRDQFAIFLFEDLAADPEGVMKTVYGHLGIDVSFKLPTTEAFNASVVPKNQRLFQAFTMANPVMKRARSLAPPRVRAFAVRTRNRYLGNAKPEAESELNTTLRSIYRDDTERLQELIDRDLTSWLGGGS